MSSIFVDPSVFGPPSEPEPTEELIINGRYMLPPIGDPTGKRRSLQRVTNFIKQISDTAGLTKWQLRCAVLGIARDERLYDLATSLHPDQTRDLDALIEKAIDLAQAGPSGGNITGTALHNYTDDVAGQYPTRVRDKWVPKVENYQRALHEQGLRVVPGLSERLVVSERYGIAGRLDDVYEDAFGIRRVGDRKSQKEFRTWFEIAAQLACYQIADAMFDEATSSFVDMPKLADDYAIVAWMPLTHPGKSPDDVELFDIPLAPARQLLDEIALVRELRRGARSWGKSRAPIGDFARCARDIRDAESQDDLRTLAAERTAVWNQDLQAMAERRWNELEVTPAPASASVPLDEAAFVAPDFRGVTIPAANGNVAYAPSSGPLPLEYAAPNPDAVTISVASNLGFGQDKTTVTASGTSDAMAAFVEKFRTPEATFPAGAGDRVHADDVSTAVPAPVLNGASRLATDPAYMDYAIASLQVASGAEPLSHMEQHPYPGDVEPRRKPAEWAARLGLPLHAPVDPEGEWCRPMTLNEFHAYRAKHQIAEAAQAVVHADAAAAGSATLDSVPIKIVKEIATRAGNSATARGRVRLLNDIESSKPGYVKHAAALIPAVLAEWLERDGAPDEHDNVMNTGGSKRAPMHGDRAGNVTLSAYLASKEGPPTIGAMVQAELDAIEGNSGTEAEAVRVDAAEQEVRTPYANIEPDKHSLLRLIEMAKGAANGAERAKVFHEITRRAAWTSAIADEINAHYRANGYAEVDFSEYFEAKALPAGAVEVGNFPSEPEMPATAAEAVRWLDSVRDLAGFQAAWQAFSTAPFWGEQAVQESVMRNMVRLK